MKNQLMPLLGLFVTSAIIGIGESRVHPSQHRGKDGVAQLVNDKAVWDAPAIQARADSNPVSNRFLSDKTEKFAVNGTGIPLVDFDVGESYAGLLPISDNENERDNLFFWFFPASDEKNRKRREITIFLNGGPGCSSLYGLFQENGPFIWRPGTQKPVRNPWSWHHLTDVVWIDQPVTVGFSTGNVTIHNEDELAQQFMGFWKNFVDKFRMQGYKVYIAGESYGGYYGSYISNHFIDANDTEYYNLRGLMLLNGQISNIDIHQQVVAEAFVQQNYNLMSFGDRMMDTIRNVSDRCGYREYLNKYYTYPPAGPQPALGPWAEKSNGAVGYKEGCELWMSIYRESILENPCFNIYNIQDHCPSLPNPIDETNYFQREDVKNAIHVPLEAKWNLCIDTAFVTEDGSNPPSHRELPKVIDKTQNVMLVQGASDFVIPANGILLAVQNMTWGGKMGFQSKPVSPFYVPRWGWGHHRGEYYGGDLAERSGVLGTTHHERGLTVVVLTSAGHGAAYQAGTATFRNLEKLLGRIDSLSEPGPFTLPQLRDIPQLEKPLGKGTYPIPWVVAGH
ncbi:hypothetical protein QQS21_001817 [Conoideocrella luteorostrata]|uniref:Carboxypeptidase n=1 Tax=Conoideocrella luteorostrata TaxID=1105319 RepID=A0AAJ0FXT3_9HYPO|nr:hypothetical protein QQS21_001817 [Conoideocrella luteorostrata]